MLHFSSVLGPTWTVILYTLPATWSPPPSSSPPLRRALDAGTIQIRHLPANTTFPSSYSVSLFLASPWLWAQLSTSRRVLLFQTDSVICAASPVSPEDFFEYDFIGAPIPAELGRGYNGGLSLRNPRLFLDVAREEDFVGDGDEFEDQWFYRKLRERRGREGGEGKAEVVLPTEHVARTFSVEGIWYDRPLGYHQPQRWQAERMGQIEAWCPEVGMLGGRRAY
ncbi:hypothetical protein NKR19_g9359 [Coniochaeta hoffmannii]|uniref:DUF5672 domain-containing protein n=1 Tax=Coniochaeta hoffmannii TaxID=91930 RepID=A0AA38RHP0_9PEZI|nr:hypothetical protein NKR19_g9359 [Coniochaeta hoffmannii]